ncbi:MSCRAMM family protein [Streptomyces acidiscabies]|uniref:alpha-amylase n=3 Tax=Streptomyces acidiscabies TaxID=42234 RepID=A0AAP6BH33_9ACTN|nr:carboxypeptidase-like regulatory domain-containing protein [Streptomyces acidiscabies]MDX2964510.1 carboxypeptidase-like regulatory domain-containing protein [Streptomyces acidiscabies]
MVGLRGRGAVRELELVASSGEGEAVAGAADLKATHGLTVSGHIHGTESTPLPHAPVTLISLGGRQLDRVVSRADGSYAVDAPGAGSYVLVASAEGYRPQAATVTVGGEPMVYDVLLAGTSGLAGTVRVVDGQAPVEGALVVTADVRGEVIASGVTGADGGFGFAGLVPGPVTVAVSADGFRPVALPVEIAVRGVTRAEVELAPGARVQGAVTASGRPVNAARVTLVDAAGNVVASAVTGADGGYAFTDLDGGDYTVTAAGYPPQVSQVTVGGAGVDGHDIELAYPGE